MMSADMTSTLSSSMPVLKRISPDVTRSYARNKFYARPPTLQLTAPSHAAAAECNAAHGAVPVRAAPGTRDELTQSVIKLAVTVKSGVKTVAMAPEPKVLMVRVEDAVRLGRLESQSNGRYRMRQEPRELQAPATHKQAHQHVEGAKIPSLTNIAVYPEVVSVETQEVRVSGQNFSEDADSGPPTLTMDDYHAKLSEEKGRMINRVFARIASVSSSHEDQQKSIPDAVSEDVIRQPEYEDISDAEDFARDTTSSETQHDLHKLPQVSSDNCCAETDAANQQPNNDANNSELLRVLEGTDSLVGGTEISPRRQVFARRTSAPELDDGTQTPVRVPLQKTTRSASLPGAGDTMDEKLRYPKMLISRCSRTNWRVVDKSKPSPANADADAEAEIEAVATHRSRSVSMEDTLCESPAAASLGGEESVNNADSPPKGGETCVTAPTDVSVIAKLQGDSVGDLSSKTEVASKEPTDGALPNLVALPWRPVDASTELVVDGKSASVEQVPSNPGLLLTATSNGDGDRVNSDAVRRLSEEKSNARPEVVASPNGGAVAKLPSANLSTQGGGKLHLSQAEVETIAGTEIPVHNDLGLGAKEPIRKRGRPPLMSLKKNAKIDDSKPSPPKMIIARKKSTSRRNFRHESIQTFKPTTAPPPWRYKGRAHVRSPDITLAPQRKLSVDLRVVETEIGQVSSPSPSELVIDLDPGGASETAGGEQEVVFNYGAGVGSSAVLKRAISEPGDSSFAVGQSQTAAVSSEAGEAVNEPGTLDDENADGGKKKRRKEEGGDVIQTVHARFATKKLHEKGRRLAQELPGYNWLEEKILNGGVTQVLPPKIVVPATPAAPAAPRAPAVPSAVPTTVPTAVATVPCASDIPEVAKRLARVTENLVITKVMQNVQQPNGISGVPATPIVPVSVQKPAGSHQAKPGEQMQAAELERHDSVARRTLIQLANGGDMQVTMERIPPQNPSAVNFDSNDMRRHEETFVAKQMLQDFNAKNQMNQEHQKRIESLHAQQRTCVVDLSGLKASPASWGFAENVETMARHTAMSFDTGMALTRGYPGPLPQISPPSNFRNTKGMGLQRLTTTASSTHCGVSALPALPQGTSVAPAPQPNAQTNVPERRVGNEQPRSPQLPPEMYRLQQVPNGSPSHVSQEKIQKESETAEGQRRAIYEQHKRSIHPRPAVPTATAAATAMSSFPSPTGLVPTQPLPPTRHQEQPGRHQDLEARQQDLQARRQNLQARHQESQARHQESQARHQESQARHQDPLPCHQDPPRPLLFSDLRTNQTHGEPSVITRNVGQIPQFLQGSPYALNQNSMQISRSPEAYGGARNGFGNIGGMLNASNYLPTRFLKQTLTDGRSRTVQETFVPGGQTASSHRSPQATPQFPANETNPFAPMTQLNTHPNLSPQAFNQLRFEQWRSGQPGHPGYIHPARVNVTPANPNALNPPQTSPQQRATVHLSNTNFHDGPLNHPFQLPPFSPPFTSIPGQTAPRPPAPPHQKSGNHARGGLVRPANPQHSLPSLVPNLRQQIPGNFQSQCQPTRYSRNMPSEHLEYLQQEALRIELKEQEVRQKHLAQLAAIQKEEQRQKATQREIARLGAAKEKAIQEARREEERLRAEQHAADLAVHREPNQRGAVQCEQPTIHTQEEWNQYRRLLRHQFREQQTVSPRSTHSQPIGPQQRMSGGRMSPRQQIHPQNCCAQQQANNQIMQVLQHQQKSPHSDVLLMQQQKQNSPLSQQASVQMSGPLVEEIHQQMRNHEHRIRQQQQQQNQQPNKRPRVVPTPPSQPLNSAITIGSHRGIVLSENGSNNNSNSTEHLKPSVPRTVEASVKLQESEKQAPAKPPPGNGRLKVLPPLLPLPESPKAVHVLEIELADKGDSQTTSDSDLQQRPVSSGETDSSSLVELDVSSDDTIEDTKFLPQAHQASLFSTATIKSGKRNSSHNFNLSPGDSAVYEPMDLSASKEKPSDPEITQSPLKVVSVDVMASLLPTICTEKTTETLADSLLLHPEVESQSKIVTNEIKEKWDESQQDAPLKSKIVEKSSLSHGNKSSNSNTSLPASSTSKTVDVSSKLVVNIEHIEGIQNICQPSVAHEKNQPRILQKWDTALTADIPVIGNRTFDDNDDSNEVMFVETVIVSKSSSGGAQTVTSQPYQVVVHQEPRFRSFSETDVHENMKAKFRAVKPINSQDDQYNSIQEKAIVDLESGITHGNSVAASARMSRAHFSILPYKQMRTTNESENVASNESQSSFQLEDTFSTVPGKNVWIRDDGNQNLLKTGPTKVCQKQGSVQNSLLVIEETSEQLSSELNDPTLKNVIAGREHSDESECNIKIADIFSITDVNEDGSYDPRRPDFSKVYQRPKLNEDHQLVKEFTAKKLTKRRSVPNQIAQPFMICSREDPVQNKAQRDMERSSIRIENHALAQSVLNQDGANVCHKRKLVENSEISQLEEELVARKLPKLTSVSNDSAPLDTAKKCQKLVLADNPVSVNEHEPTPKMLDHQPNVSRQTSQNQSQLYNLDGNPAAQPSTSSHVDDQDEASPKTNDDSDASEQTCLENNEVIVMCELCGSPASCSCSNCGMAHYCGRDCQVFHWGSTHSYQCKLWAERWRT